MTGRYPMRYGLQTLSIQPWSTFGLSTEERVMAQTVKDAGYRTAAFGEWRLGNSRRDLWPTRRGFHYFYGSLDALSARFRQPGQTIRRPGCLGHDHARQTQPAQGSADQRRGTARRDHRGTLEADRLCPLPARHELYNIHDDPSEEDNRAEREPQKMQKLLARLNEFAREMAPSLYLADLARARKHDAPIFWGENPLRP